MSDPLPNNPQDRQKIKWRVISLLVVGVLLMIAGLLVDDTALLIGFFVVFFSVAVILEPLYSKFKDKAIERTRLELDQTRWRKTASTVSAATVERRLKELGYASVAELESLFCKSYGKKDVFVVLDASDETWKNAKRAYRHLFDLRTPDRGIVVYYLAYGSVEADAMESLLTYYKAARMDNATQVMPVSNDGETYAAKESYFFPFVRKGNTTSLVSLLDFQRFQKRIVKLRFFTHNAQREERHGPRL